jgi:hypothetical protein
MNQTAGNAACLKYSCSHGDKRSLYNHVMMRAVLLLSLGPRWHRRGNTTLATVHVRTWHGNNFLPVCSVWTQCCTKPQNRTKSATTLTSHRTSQTTSGPHLADDAAKLEVAEGHELAAISPDPLLAAGAGGRICGLPRAHVAAQPFACT